MKEFKYELSIGMIFRDDIKYIRKCLETMQPLRDAIPCQLIMTDTGSVDGSRAVAEEFADVLIDFEWCDDFSAARNTGTEIAEGRWFVYFDCDHEFDESILEIAKFLQSKESHQVRSASVNIRNYKHEGNYLAYDNQVSYLMRSFEEKKDKFVNPIHEAFLIFGETGPILPTVVHHWGGTKAKMPEKNQRNATILEKSIAENPENMHQHLQYLFALTDHKFRYEKALEAVEIGEKTDPNHKSLYCIYTNVAHLALEFRDFEKFDLAQAKMKDVAPTSHLQLEYLGLAVQGAHKRKDYAEAVRVFPEYRKLYVQLKKEEDKTFLGMTDFLFFKEGNYHQLTLLAVKCANDLQDKQSAEDFLQQCTAYAYQESEDEHLYVQQYLHYVKEAGLFQFVAPAYEQCVKDKCRNEILLFQDRLSQWQNELTPENCKTLLTSLAKNPVDSYTASLSIRLQNYDSKAFTPKIMDIIQGDDSFLGNPQNAHLLYGYIKTGSDPSTFVMNNEVNSLIHYTSSLFSEFPDMISLVEQAYNDPNFAITTLKEEKLWAYLGYRSALFLAEQENPNPVAVSKLFSQATALMSGLADKLYNPYLLSPEGKGVLPSEELFAHFVMEANNEPNPAQYVNKLKTALGYCPAYAPILKCLMSAAKVQQPAPPEQAPSEKSAEPKAEFSQLGTQIKNTIKTLLTSGDKAQAKVFLEKYKAIAPTDPDIAQLESEL